MQTLNMHTSFLQRPSSGRSQPTQCSLTQRCRPQLGSAFRQGTHLRQRVSNGVVCRAFFKLGGQTSQSGGVYGAQKRDDYIADDVEQYFNYMGMLAEEGTYDRLQQVLASDLHPADILLQWAAGEGDAPKAAELLRAGADPTAKTTAAKTEQAVTAELLRSTGNSCFILDMDGKTPEELTKNEEILAMLADPQKAQDFEKQERA